MSPQDFAYWLQGFVELNPDMKQPTPAQWKAIKEHLQLVFTKVTPPVEQAPLTLPSTPLGPLQPQPEFVPWWDPMNPNRVTCTVYEVPLDMKSMTYC